MQSYRPNKYLLIAILQMFSIVMMAQNVTFFSSKQGLSNSCVRNIYEDSRHNIWITTLNGLNRYDGVKMNVYRHSDTDSTSLQNDESTWVYDYDKERVLVGTTEGMQIYYHDTDRFSHLPIRHITSGDDMKVRVIRSYKTSSGKHFVCFATYGCGELIEDKDGQLVIKQTTEYNTGNDAGPIQFYEDRKNQLWVINSQRQVFRFTGKKKSKQYPVIHGAVKMCQSSTGKTYVATIDDGLYAYDERTDEFTQVATSAECGFISSISAWNGGRIFICADGGGLRVYDEKTNTTAQSSIQTGDFNIATSNVKDAMVDSFGNVWVGIYLKGVMVKTTSKSSFEYVGRLSITKNSLGTNSIVSLCPAENGKMWVSTDNSGLYLLSADGKSSIHYDPDERPGMPRTFTAIAPVCANGTSSPSYYLLGTFLDGIYKIANGNISLLNKDIDYVFDIQPAGKGFYWIATMGLGFFYYNPTSGECKHYGQEYNRTAKDGEKIQNDYITCIRQCGSRLFVGTYDGLNGSDVKDGHFRNNKKILSGTAICHMTELNGTIWCATNKGLFAVNAKTLDYQRYTVDNGLPINSLKSIVEDKGKLWIGTDNGLACFDPKTKECINFFDIDGLQDNEFSLRTALKANDKLYFGGISGLTYFNQKDISKDMEEENSMHLRLVDLLIYNRTVHVGDKSGSYDILNTCLEDGCEINLAHSDNHFSVQLVVDGVSNQHVTYEYSINGSDWQEESQNVNRLVFDNLAPGTYDISIRARGLNTVSDEHTFKVIIHAPWYASIWARLFYFIVFAVLCWLAYDYARRKMHIRSVIMQHRQEQELNEARIQFFMNISHEIRTPMTLILAPLEKLLNTDKDESRQRNYMLIKQNSNRILRLINQMMDVRKIEQGKFQLNYSKVELVSLLQSIFDVFTTNAQNRNITYEFQHPMRSLIAYVDPENIDKIVMNLLSNAFKFTPDKGKIVLSLTLNQTQQDEEQNDENEKYIFQISVSDTGCGIEDSEKSKVFDRFYSSSQKNGYIGTGIGLNLTYMLTKLHKGAIKVEDNPEGKGTLFLVDIPIGEKELVANEPVVDENTEETKEDELLTPSNADLTAPEMVIDKPSVTHNKHILLVEDDENIRQYVHTELSNEFVIQECTNGQEAWDYTINHPDKVNVIISDIMMPVMDGMTLCQKVKSNFVTNHIPIILMTALGSDADRIAGLTNGADAYVPKPFNIDVLRSTALNLLKNRLLLQGKYNGEKQQEEKIEKKDVETPDEHLMRRVMKVINENIDNPDLSVEVIADKVGISRVHFYRKMKDLTGQSPRDYLKYVRLKEAARLISEKPNIDITSVSVAVGFKSLSSFSTNFKALFGKSPSEYAKG